MLLTNIWSLAQYNPINPDLIEEIEKLFKDHGMVNCGRLETMAETDDEFIIDPENFKVNDLYDRRTPRTHFFAIYNVMPSCPLDVGRITKREMDADDEIFDSEIDVMMRKRCLSVHMKLRPNPFETEEFEYEQAPIEYDDVDLVVVKTNPRYTIRHNNGMWCVFDLEIYITVEVFENEDDAKAALAKL